MGADDSSTATAGEKEDSLATLLGHQQMQISRLGLEIPRRALKQAQSAANLEYDQFLVPYVSQFLSTLLLLPDNPQQKGNLQLLRKLLNFIQDLRFLNPFDKLRWSQHISAPPSADQQAIPSMMEIHAAKCDLYLVAFELLCAYFQREYLYRSECCANNATLYCMDEAFQSSLRKLAQVILIQVRQGVDALLQPTNTSLPSPTPVAGTTPNATTGRMRAISLLPHTLLVLVQHVEMDAAGVEALRTFGEILLLQKTPSEQVGFPFKRMLTRVQRDDRVDFLGLQKFDSLDPALKKTLFQILNKLSKS